MSELQPCPFCGGSASIYPSSDHSTAWEGGCGNQKCRVSPQVWELTEADALAAWNGYRAASTAKEAEVKRLRDALEKIAQNDMAFPETNYPGYAGMAVVTAREALKDTQ